MPQVYSGDGDLLSIGAKADQAASGPGAKASVIALLKGLLAELGDEEGDSDLIDELRAIRLGMEQLCSLDTGDLLALARADRLDD